MEVAVEREHGHRRRGCGLARLPSFMCGTSRALPSSVRTKTTRSGWVLPPLGAHMASSQICMSSASVTSDSVLSERLSELGGAGLVARTAEEGPPLSVTYALTDSGSALLPALRELTAWAAMNLPA